MADSWDRSGLHGFPEPPSATGAEEQDRNGAHRQLPASVAFRVPPAPWTDSSAHSLVAALGAGHNGPVLLDFVAEGPHALIAGTTGSGKSALVTSLVLDLMCRYPPHDLAFMLIDFKGGSTLAPFGNMPHCQALVTDLGVETADRTLQGLRAEVVRRERVLKNAAAADYAQYRNAGRSSDAMPRLLVVVDEFRVLTDELPHALTELMRIATVGRSLGIHLLLATQRPQGVITGEMRANINAIVSLRLLSTFDSDELLGSGVAAEIPASAPGRGFIRKGGEAPVAFQAAHAASVHEGWRLTRVGPSLTDAGPSVHLEAPEGPATTPRGIMEKITAHRPTYTVPTPAFAPPLPDRLTAVARRFRTGQEPASIAIGLVDAVEEQCLKPLWWEPNRMPRLAIVAGPAGGAHGCLQRLVMAAARREPECHIYVLDGMNTLAGSAALPRVAGYVGADEPERVLEMLELLERAGTADAGTQRVLAVTGLAAWSVVLGGSGFIQLDDRLAALARNATSAGLAIVVVGDRDLTSSRFFPMAEHRLYCPFGLGEETVLAWPRLRPVSAVPGRAVWIGPGSPAPGVVVQLVDDAPGSTPEAPFPRPAAPLRACLPLPRELRARELRRLGSTDGTSHPADVDAGWLIGVSGPDNRAWRWSPGNLGLVLGAGGTGKTSVLRLLAAMSPGTTAVLGFSVPGPRPLADFPIEAGVGCGMPTLILVDNATELGALERSLLAQWHDRGAHIVLAALPGSQLYSMLPLPGIRPSPGGAILLNPRSAEDGNFLGWCFPPDTALLPGRALVMANGSLQRIQCALPD
jgi:S-DNA-T family DNA segregation ATPase FtsK/SpoIIIE